MELLLARDAEDLVKTTPSATSGVISLPKVARR